MDNPAYCDWEDFEDPPYPPRRDVLVQGVLSFPELNLPEYTEPNEEGFGYLRTYLSMAMRNCRVFWDKHYKNILIVLLALAILILAAQLLHRDAARRKVQEKFKECKAKDTESRYRKFVDIFGELSNGTISRDEIKSAINEAVESYVPIDLTMYENVTSLEQKKKLHYKFRGSHSQLFTNIMTIGVHLDICRMNLILLREIQKGLKSALSTMSARLETNSTATLGTELSRYNLMQLPNIQHIRDIISAFGPVIFIGNRSIPFFNDGPNTFPGDDAYP